MAERALAPGGRRLIEVGIKTGLKNWRETDWSAVNADFAEVHFQVGREDDYLELIQFLRRRGIEPGLHFWGVLPGNILPSFAVSNCGVREQTIELLTACIRFAAAHECAYVVYHPGSRRICQLDLSSGQFTVTAAEETPAEISRQLFLENARRIHGVAAQFGIPLIVEIETRLKPTWCFDETRTGEAVDAGDQTPETLGHLASGDGVPLCVDTAHLATWYSAQLGGSRSAMLAAMVSYIRSVGASIQLVHVASLLPPYEVDTTSGFSPEEISAGVFPNREELLQLLLEVCRHRHPIKVVPEPRIREHVWHNRLLWQFVERVEASIGAEDALKT